MSFDIFDTLIFRKCTHPTDVFDDVALQLEIESAIFKEDRIQIEQRIRKQKKKGEVCIEEIYDKLHRKYDIGKEHGIHTEETIEMGVCYANPEIKAVYDYCIMQGKKICITTDMYLTEACISEILAKNGYYCYDKLFISSIYGKRKGTGQLFDILIEKIGVPAYKILHIGDNFLSDFLMAKRKGLKSYLYKGKPKIENQIELLLNEFLKNSNKANRDFYEMFGYNILGPAIYGYVIWLNRQLKNKGIKKVFFLAREGQFIKRVFDTIVSDDFEKHYLFVSRRSLAVPAISTVSTMEDFLALRPMYNRVKVKNQIAKVGLNISDLKDWHCFSEDNLNKVFGELDAITKKNIQEALFVESKKKSYCELDLLLKYLNQEHVAGMLAVIDLGWNGSMQRALVQLLKDNNVDVDIYGFFMAQRDGFYKNASHIKNMGFLFNYDAVSAQENLLLNSGTNLLELLFSADHGSTIRYTILQDKIVPELEDYEYAHVYPVIRRCQDAALKFAKDFHSKYGFAVCGYEKELFKPMYRTLKRPDRKVIQYFGNMPYSDMNETKLVLAKKCSIFKLKDCIKAFNDSGWKVGFIKRNFKIRYSFEIYWLLRKLFNG
nr:hypothetical protein [uncultured Acetatifactor sp.]